MIPEYDERGVTIYQGDSLEVMREMPENSVAAIVTDPPYGISFMGKKWDYKVPSVELWREALRVLKPGGYLLSFAGSRTYHRITVNIEDAGFEIRDQIMWIYGSGFPKSLDISKAIDKAAGVEREVVGINHKWNKSPKAMCVTKRYPNGNIPNAMPAYTAPATPEAQQWDGWGTALKPAHEPICVARKPLTGTVAENVLKYGTGGLNIDGGRIGTNEELRREKGGWQTQYVGGEPKTINTFDLHPEKIEGRFPANIILDPEAGEILDKQSGYLTSGANPERRNSDKFRECYGEFEGQENCDPARGIDSGGASRFFYCPKASRDDRDEGLEGMELKNNMRVNAPRESEESKTSTQLRNFHPTVKPVDLMQYLVRLVTSPRGIVLDPFMGSGSTGKAAVRENFKFIGIEREKEYLPIAIARINAPAQVELL